MKTSRYTNEQIVPALRQAEGGTPVVIRDTPSERTGAVRAQPDAPARAAPCDSTREYVVPNHRGFEPAGRVDSRNGGATGGLRAGGVSPAYREGWVWAPRNRRRSGPLGVPASRVRDCG